MPTKPRVAAVQGRRRSNAAGPHGTGRRPAPDADQITREEAEAAWSAFAREPELDLADDAHKAGDDHFGKGGGTEPSH